MTKHILSLLGAAILTIAIAAIALAQTPATTTKTVVQNPDGTFTVIEYPAKKEVMLNLTPSTSRGRRESLPFFVTTTGQGSNSILQTFQQI